MYEVLIDELVFKEDFKNIANPDRQRIIRAIGRKLPVEPERYGQRLRGGLAGLWKLRVGRFRVVYEVKKDKVLVYVIKVGFRRDDEVYTETLKRIRQLKGHR